MPDSENQCVVVESPLLRSCVSISTNQIRRVETQRTARPAAFFSMSIQVSAPLSQKTPADDPGR